MYNIYSKCRNAALVLGLGMASVLVGCSDSYMEDLNTDKSKASVAEPAYQLTFALLSTYGSFASMEAVRAWM